MTTPFRFIDDDNLIIPRRRFGQPPSQRGRQHGAVVLTGLPAVSGDDAAEAQDTTDATVKTTSPRVEFTSATRKTEKPTSQPSLEPKADVACEQSLTEQTLQVPTQQMDIQRRFDSRHAAKTLPESPPLRRSQPSKSTVATPKESDSKDRDAVGRWASVLLTTLAVVGAILFLAGLLAGRRQADPEAPMSDWQTNQSPAVVVTGADDDSQARNVVPRVESSVADLAASPPHPVPTLATVELPADGPAAVGPEITLHKQLLGAQSVLNQDTSQENPVSQMSLQPPTSAASPNAAGTQPAYGVREGHGIDQYNYPTTDPSTYRPSPTTGTSLVTPPHPGTARLDGNIHNYRRPQ